MNTIRSFNELTTAEQLIAGGKEAPWHGWLSGAYGVHHLAGSF
jgi:hypothetical protein